MPRRVRTGWPRGRAAFWEEFLGLLSILSIGSVLMLGPGLIRTVFGWGRAVKNQQQRYEKVSVWESRLMDLHRWIQMGTSRSDFQTGVCIRIAGGLVKT